MHITTVLGQLLRDNLCVHACKEDYTHQRGSTLGSCFQAFAVELLEQQLTVINTQLMLQ